LRTNTSPSRPGGPSCRSHITLATLIATRDKPQIQTSKSSSRATADLVMASVNGGLSPLSHSDSANSSITLSAKRKRDDSTEDQNHVNGISDSKSDAASVPPTSEDSQALIRDLIDVLKTYVILGATSHCHNLSSRRCPDSNSNNC
jgi:hypothetical protein